MIKYKVKDAAADLGVSNKEIISTWRCTTFRSVTLPCSTRSFSGATLSADAPPRKPSTTISFSKDWMPCVLALNSEFYAEKISDTFEESIDVCMEALSKQLLKAKEKLQGK